MEHQARRAAIAAYKKRESVAGIYVVRSAASGEAWVGHTPDIDAIRNRIWFSLRTGGHTNRPLQAAWNRDGEAAFSLEPLELVDDETLGFMADKVLRSKAGEWRAKLSAGAV